MTTYYLNIGINDVTADIWIQDLYKGWVDLARISADGSASIELPFTLSRDPVDLQLKLDSSDSLLWVHPYDGAFADGTGQPHEWVTDPITMAVGIHGKERAYVLSVVRNGDSAHASSTIEKIGKLQLKPATHPGTNSPAQGLPDWFKNLGRRPSPRDVWDALFEAVAELTASGRRLTPGVVRVLQLEARQGNRRAEALVEEAGHALEVELSPESAVAMTQAERQLGGARGKQLGGPLAGKKDR